MQRRVLIPTDFSSNAENAVRYAFQIFGDSENTEFVLLNAYDIPRGGNATMLVSITDILKSNKKIIEIVLYTFVPICPVNQFIYLSFRCF